MQKTCVSWPRQLASGVLGMMSALMVIAAMVGTTPNAVSAQSITEASALGSAGLPIPAAAPQTQSEANSQPEMLAPAPAYCNPCLYYSGDLNIANGDGLANENDGIVSLSQVFTPFTIPTGHTWLITGVLINTLTEGGAIHVPKKAEWSIWKGTAASTPGTVFAAGANRAVFTATGRSVGGGTIPEYTASVTLPQPVALGAGTYFLNVMPQCTDPSSCSSQRFFLSNVTDVAPLHHHGSANVLNASIWNSNFFGESYVNAGVGISNGSLFSFGIIGTCVTSTGAACFF